MILRTSTRTMSSSTKVEDAGTVSENGGSSTPSGWLLCNGQAVSRTTYARLFDVIGTTYGAGDLSTTFNVPLLVNASLNLGFSIIKY